jgi:hypothetical protein
MGVWPMVMWSCWSRCDGDGVIGEKMILTDSIVALASEKSLDHVHHTVSTSTLSSQTYVPQWADIALWRKGMSQRLSVSLTLCVLGKRSKSAGQSKETPHEERPCVLR